MADPWGNMPATPIKSSGDDTAGSKGKIIMSPNTVTRKGIDPVNGGSRNSNGIGWGK